jgi:hypothetical protein
MCQSRRLRSFAFNILNANRTGTRRPIVPAPRRVARPAVAPAREHPELAEIIADMLAERLVEGAVRMVLTALI